MNDERYEQLEKEIRVMRECLEKLEKYHRPKFDWYWVIGMLILFFLLVIVLIQFYWLFLPSSFTLS